MNLAAVNAPPAGEASSSNDGPLGIVVRSYSPVGVVQSYGQLEIEARELVFLDAKKAEHFIRISVKEEDSFGRTGSCAILDTDVEKLISLIERLATVLIKTDRFDFTEVEAEISGLKLIIFNNSRGGLDRKSTRLNSSHT